ncbi:MAG: cyclic nucleotide-binding domain-containing protein, partial [Spirochaetota bacterium]|nr:cyclic nucleotide-binding domain-containing protein [Spirochaetota bacterium]
AGDMFGEMAVTQGTGSRNASVLAMSPVTLCEMSEEIFFSLIIREGFKDKLIGQWDYRRLLERLPFFKDCPHLILERLSIASTLNKYKAGEEIPVSGEKGSNFYIILSGEVVRKNEEGLLSLKAGDYFGDFGQKTGQKGIYNSKEDSHLLAIEKQDMVKILMKTPQLLFRLKNKALVS